MNESLFRRPKLASPIPRPLEQADAIEPFIGGEATPFVTRYLRFAKRWKWLLIGSIVTSLIFGLLVTLLMTPKYTAVGEIEIQRESARVVNVQGVEPEASPADQEFYQTQYGLLRSETLAERVATELRLYENANFFEMFGKSKTADELRALPHGTSSAKRNEHVRAAAKILLDNMDINPERLSRLVIVRFTGPDRALSAAIVNAWTRLFIDTSLSRRFEATAYARNFLEQRLAQLRVRLQDSERALVQYATNQRIINIPANAQGGAQVERPIVAEDLAALDAELNAATAARVAAESRLSSNGGLTAEALSNQAISELRSRRAQLASDRAKLVSQFQPDYPPVRSLDDQIANIDQSISREESRIRGTLSSNFAAASSRESELRSRVQDLESSMMDLRRRTIEYNILQRDVDTNRQLYDALLQRYKEVGVAGGVGVNNISVVDSAEVPEKPSSPRMLLNLFIAGLLGTAAGIALALLLDQADEAISDPRELETKLGLPLLGTIPKSKDEAPMADLEDPKSALIEAYLSVQTRLAFTTEHGVPASLALTSTVPGEGKSTTAYALARTLARTGRRVIILDADMRSPSQHELFGTDNDRGLSNYLSGGELASLIRDMPQVPNLKLVTAGPMPPNAAELLTSGRLGQLIDELSARFDHVIVDAPPVMGLADTPLIASSVEGCVFVVECHKTSARMAQVALERLHASRVRVLGGMLTMFDPKRADFGYGYNYGYGYGKRDGQSA